MYVSHSECSCLLLRTNQMPSAPTAATPATTAASSVYSDALRPMSVHTSWSGSDHAMYWAGVHNDTMLGLTRDEWHLAPVLKRH